MPNYIANYLENFQFSHPCALLVSGTTGAGKSFFIKNLIEKNGIKGTISTIYYFMPRLEPLEITPLPHQKLYVLEGMPTNRWYEDTFNENTRDTLIIIDDMWSECIESEVVRRLLTHGRRHLGISLAFTAQNFFERSKQAITLRYVFYSIYF